MNCLGNVVNYCENAGVTLGIREPGDETEGYMGPGSVPDRKRSEMNNRRLIAVFFLSGADIRGIH